MKKILLTGLALLGMTVAASAAYVCNENTDYVNVRSGPSALSYGIVDKVDNGHPVVVVNGTYNANGYYWVKVRYNSNRYGRHSIETGWIDASAVCN